MLVMVALPLLPSVRVTACEVLATLTCCGA